MIYLSTKFHIPSSSVSLVITIKRKAKYRSCCHQLDLAQHKISRSYIKSL
jgi:hypothetical protein